MQTDTTTNEVTILSGPASSLASTTTLGSDVTLSKTNDALQLSPARLRLGRLALECQGNGCYCQVSPDADGSTDPTVFHTKMGLDFTTGHIAIGTTHNPFDQSRLFVLGDIRCNGLHTNQVQFGDGSLLTQTLSNLNNRITSLERGGGGGLFWTVFSNQQSLTLATPNVFQEYWVILETTAPCNGEMVVAAFRADGSASIPSEWQVEQGYYTHRPHVFTDGILYLTGRLWNATGETDPATIRVQVTRGIHRTLFCAHTFYRNDQVPGVMELFSHGSILHNDVQTIQISIQVSNTAFSGQWMQTV